MRRIDPNVVAGVIMTALCGILAVPVALEQLAGVTSPAGPPWLWWAVYAAFLAALLVGGWLDEVVGAPAARALLGVLVVTSAALVLLGAAFGWLPILLVVTASLSTYHAPRAVTAAIVAGNVVVAAAATRVAGAPVEVALVTGAIYLLLQSASVLLIVALHREEAARRRLAAAHAELAAAGAALAETSRAQERLRISRELHDLVGHQLTALALELETATHRGADPGGHVARARGLAGDLLADVRSTVGELRRRAPDLAATLHRISTQLPRPVVHVRVADGLAPDEERTVAVVRCVQEILTNAIRHGDAGTVWIDVSPTGDGGLHLSARDDGRGAGARVVPGNGLRGMAERAAALGGTVRWGPAAPHGFAVTAVLP
ncbi:sensor histidine kinase [Pseudonocardia spirodelae]|uniref:Histidine kinase n=1 Tax=Pseudonocardia spirodelae TaxID=3133431 RepID=A0ABU8T7I1_9PSEU